MWARDEGSGRASRLLWTLDVIGHPHYSLLNGSLHAWLNDRHPVSAEAVRRPRSQYTVKFRDTVLADKNYIVSHLRLKPAQELKQVLSQLGVTPDKEAIVYCQTHHRSAHT